MNKLFNKIAAIGLGMVAAIGVGVGLTATKDVVGAKANSTNYNSESIVFKSGASDNSRDVSSLDANNLVETNTLINASAANSFDKVYAGKSGAKLGTGSKTGSFTLVLNANCNSNIKTIEFKTAQYSSDSGTLTFKNGSATLKTGFTPSTGTYTHTFSEPTTVQNITVSTSEKRAYVKSITVTYEAPVIDEEEGTLQSIKLSGTYKTSFNYGDTFTYDGLVVTGVYDVEPLEREITSFGITTPDMLVSGTQQVVVSVGEVSASYNITVGEPKAEPAIINATSIQEIKDFHTSADMYETQKFHIELTVSVLGQSGTADQYGNLIVSDGTDEILVYGSTTQSSAFVFDKVTGKYTFNNPKDFLTNAVTSQINVGYVLEMEVTYLVYNSTKPELYAVILNATEPELAEVASIEVITTNATTEFRAGDTFTSEGLVVRVTDTNETILDIEEGFTTNLDGKVFDESDVGTMTVVVSYSEKTDTYEIEIVSGYVPFEHTYDFSTYPAGVQYADETHVLDQNLTMHIVKCHLTTQLRIYSSEANPGVAEFSSSLNMTKVVLNAGYKADTLQIFISDNGTDWTEDGTLTTTSSYADLSYTFTKPTKYFKLDVVGTQQVRIAKMTVTFKPENPFENEANEYATLFLEEISCDSTGSTAPTGDWDTLAELYGELSDNAKAFFENATANTSGTVIEQAVAKYDYILAKYGTTDYTNFIGRTVTPLNSVKPILSMTGDNNIGLLVAAISLVALTSTCLYFVSRRKKQLSK